MQRAKLTRPQLEQKLREAPTQFEAGNKKFVVGKNPLERERELDVIQPQNAQQQKRMLEIMKALYKDAATDPARANALEMWRVQLEGKDAEALVKTDFQRRFQFWLLGRGTPEDTAKTFWGRGNMAAHNPEIAAYIDQFLEARANYAMQLALLANRAPTTLLGAYLYFKYIVNGNLKQTTENGKTWWHLDQGDFLEDFDLFRKYFDRVPDEGNRPAKNDDKYSKMIQPQSLRPANRPSNDGTEPYPITTEEKAQWGLSPGGDIDQSIAVIQGTIGNEAGAGMNQPPPKRGPGPGGANGPSDPPVPPADVPSAPTNAPGIDPAAILSQVNTQLQQERMARDKADAEREQRFATEREKDRAAERERFDKMMALLREGNVKSEPASAPVASTTAEQRAAERAETEAMFKRVFADMKVEATVDPTHISGALQKAIETNSAETRKAFDEAVAKLQKQSDAAPEHKKFMSDFIAAHQSGLKDLETAIKRLDFQRPFEEISKDVVVAKEDSKRARASAEAARRDFENRRIEAEVLKRQEDAAKSRERAAKQKAREAADVARKEQERIAREGKEAAKAAKQAKQAQQAEKLEQIEASTEQLRAAAHERFTKLEQEGEERKQEIGRVVGGIVNIGTQFSTQLQNLFQAHAKAERELNELRGNTEATALQVQGAENELKRQSKALSATRAQAEAAFNAQKAKLTELNAQIATYEERIRTAEHDKSHGAKNVAALQQAVAELRSQFEQGQRALTIAEQRTAHAAPAQNDEMPPLEPNVVDQNNDPIPPFVPEPMETNDDVLKADALAARVQELGTGSYTEQRNAVQEWADSLQRIRRNSKDAPPVPEGRLNGQEINLQTWIKSLWKWQRAHGSKTASIATERKKTAARDVKTRREEKRKEARGGSMDQAD